MHKQFIGIVIIIILLIIFVYVFRLVEDYDAPIYPYQDIKNRFKTGDIVLFSREMYDSIFDKLVYNSRTKLMNSVYGHAGVVIRKNDDIYITECCGYSQTGFEKAKHLNDKKMGGVRIIKMDTLLREYYKNNKGICAVKFISKEIPYAQFMKNMARYKDVVFQDRNVLVMLAITDIFLSHKLAIKISKKYTDDKMICTEFVYNILRDCQVLDAYPGKLFWPHTITNKVFDKLEIIGYSKPYKFVIDYKTTQ